KGGNMPLINGACVPHYCMTRQLSEVGAVAYYVVVAGSKLETTVVDVTKQMPDVLQKGLKLLRAAKDVSCDGCVAHVVNKFNPPLQVPASVVVSQDISEGEK